MATKKGAQGLRFTLPGAPNVPHTVRGHRGRYWPNKLTPVGGPGEVGLELAKASDKDPGIPLSLESMTQADADRRRQEIAAERGRVSQNIAAAVREGGAEGELAKDELAELADAESGAATNDDTKES
jgi:hypothetical protein